MSWLALLDLYCTLNRAYFHKKIVLIRDRTTMDGFDIRNYVGPPRRC